MGVVAVLVAVLVVVTRDGDGSAAVDPSLTAPLAASQDGEWSIGDAPDAYRVVYRRDTYDLTGAATVTTEERTVRRPYESTVVTKDGAPPGGGTLRSYVQSFGTVSQLSFDAVDPAGTSTTGSAPAGEPVAAEPIVSGGIPRAVSADPRYDVVLADLVEAGAMQMRERRTLLGRDCQVYRTGQSPDGGRASEPTADDYTDVCVDRQGMILEGVSVEGGRVVSHLTATELDLSPDLADDLFEIAGSPPNLADGGIEVVELAADAVPSPAYWVLHEVPAGSQHRGRFEIRQPQIDPSTGTAVTGDDGTPVIASNYVDVYVSGNRTIIVRQGPTSVEGPSIADGGASFRVGGLGIAQGASGPNGSHLTAHPSNPAEWYVQLEATLPLDDLVGLARGMHTVTSPP